MDDFRVLESLNKSLDDIKNEITSEEEKEQIKITNIHKNPPLNVPKDSPLGKMAMKVLLSFDKQLEELKNG